MDEEPIAALNVIPFVDIMLVLLTVVLTTANFIATGRIPVSLPQASRSQVEKHQDKTIELTVNGDIHLDGTLVSKDDLESQLRALPADSSFLIRADRNLAFQGFIDVVDVLKRLNFTKVAVQTQTSSR
ncbi:MAG: biopolymer transporter ExbD [Bradyrhizobium sp.]|uniref:ExbD/TolR family protein n=1 Tax=Bradyrhizobium sp. TaxID=376 RepID=UPI0023A2E14E|nr:biopolymer transporter ExbD [Bradyrhizobium sp.]MDE2329298.1 biopolymer transporter ExbD [Bradyrhizobium sp.]MDE2603297.1 biopolymer transporter ExbD [Bradyrhizobium sp.]